MGILGFVALYTNQAPVKMGDNTELSPQILAAIDWCVEKAVQKALDTAMAKWEGRIMKLEENVDTLEEKVISLETENNDLKELLTKTTTIAAIK